MRKYIKSQQQIDSELVDIITDKYNINKKIAEYIIKLGYTNLNEINDYLNHKEIFYDPFTLRGMKEAVAQIKLAIQEKKRILVFGDYDVDGISATAILVLYFRSIGVNVDYFLPSRLEDGYGLSIETIDKVIETFNPEFIITVDCGISCAKEIEYLKSKGVQVIVTDHHEIPDVLPNTITIAPKLPNQKYPFKDLCGAGVALKLVNALSDLETAKKYYTICSFATIADLVELRDENRFIVYYGLSSFEKYCPKGIKKLLLKDKIKSPTTSDIAFKLAPKLNAPGRMGDATLSLQLFLSEEDNKINYLCEQLNELNIKRQTCCNDIFDRISKNIHLVDDILIVHEDDFESGVLGIVCSKFVRLFNKPTIILTLDKRTNKYVGSARGPKDYNIFEILNHCSKYLATFGGHSRAGGLTVDADNLAPFCQYITEYVNSLKINPIKENYDIDICENDLNEAFYNDLTKLEPFGVGNKKPIIALNNSTRKVSIMNKYPSHITLQTGRINGVGFGMSKYFELLNTNTNINLIIEPFIAEYKGNKQLKYYLQDIDYDSVSPNQEMSNACLIKSLFYNELSTQNTNEMSNNNNTLYISFDGSSNYENYEVIDFGRLSHQTNHTTLLVCPVSYYGYEAFSNIVFENKVNDGLIGFLSKIYPKSNVFQGERLIDCKNFNISFDKKVFGLVFNMIKNLEIVTENDYTYYVMYVKDKMAYSQFVFCYKVLEDIGVISVQDKESYFTMRITDKVSDLNNCKIYVQLKEGV